jgi:integrase
MRIKATFTLFPRKLPSGRTVFYFQCYDENGLRQNGRSTGCSKKTEATAYCMRLYREGTLVPKKKTMTFGEFAVGWWDVTTCKYLALRQLSDPFSEGTIAMNKANTENYLKDFFGNIRLGDITKDVMNEWFLYMKGKGLSASTTNTALKTLRVMLDEAVNRGIIPNNPAKEVKELKTEEAKRLILTLGELRKLFPANWTDVWDNAVICKAHKLAACTGMRISELRGLRGEYVFEDYIHVCGQYTRLGYKGHTKTKQNRDIPIPAAMRRELEELIRENGEGFVFSEDGGKEPITMERINRGFEKALVNIGIDHKQRLERNLSFHAWRHFFNTVLRMNDVTDAKVQSVTGHRSRKMTDHYTHFDTREFTEVREVQTKLLTGKDKVQGAKGKGRGKKQKGGKKQGKAGRRGAASA